jgi:hypothetical protein
MKDDLRELRNALLIGLVVIAITLGLSSWAKCEVIAFHAPLNADGTNPCRDCIAMEPVEKAAQREGYDIRQTNDAELLRQWRITWYPTYVNVGHTVTGRPFVAGYIKGPCSPGQLRRLCVMPVAASVGAAARSAVRSIVSPIPLLEW